MKWISYIVLYGGTVPKATHFQPKRSVFHAQMFESLDTPCRSAAHFTACCLRRRVGKSQCKPAFSQSGTQGVSMTWTIENLYFDGRLLALDVLVSPSDARYSACNDVLGDYADFTEADDARAEGFVPLGFYCEADIWADSVPETGSVLGSGERKGSEAMRRFRWMLTSEEAAQVRSIHLDCGIMETPG